LAAEVVAATWSVFGMMALGMVIHWLPSTWKNAYREKFASAHWSMQLVLSMIAIVIAYQVLSADLQPFIYFAF